MGCCRVILISSVRPEPSTGGSLILHRHFSKAHGISIEAYGTEPKALSASALVRRFFGRLAQTPLFRLAHDFWVWWEGRWLDNALPQVIAAVEPVVVLTIAQGDACGAARRFAFKHRLPFATIFHDWWPDIPPVHDGWRRVLERQFRDLYSGSSLALCVSDGMRAELGPHPRARLLYPIPQARVPHIDDRLCDTARPLRIVYAGNLGEYGPMIASALCALRGHSLISLEVRGSNPRWPASLKKEFRASGQWLEFAPRNQLEPWLARADVFLIPMVFDVDKRRRMETSFPSKLPEFAQFGKPLVIWGPEYCSAVKWARKGDRALCVTDPRPAVLVQRLESLIGSATQQRRLGIAAKQAARTDFDPEVIQAQFIGAMRSITQICQDSAGCAGKK